MQNASLNCVEATIVSLKIVVVLFRLPMIAQHSDLRCDFRIVRCHRSCFAASTKVLARVEAERRCPAHRARLPPTRAMIEFARQILSSMGLTSIFDNDQSVLFTQRNDRVHIRHLSVKMNRNDSRYWPSAALTDELSRLVDRALVVQIVAKLLRVHVVRAFVDVDELGKS